MPVAEFPGAEAFLPARDSLRALRAAVQDCRGCPLYRNATQAVFGEGRVSASMLLIGEQPGHEEDLAGRPFVGPAGRMLDRALESAGIARDDVFVTNAVKHFKFEPRGERRLHKRPTVREIAACRPWIEHELAVVKPRVVVCLGATAAQTLLGSSFRLTKHRGEVFRLDANGARVDRKGDAGDADDIAFAVIATLHPSAVLRQRSSAERERALSGLVDDLRLAERVARDDAAAMARQLLAHAASQ